jgi:hypothetical protein
MFCSARFDEEPSLNGAATMALSKDLRMHTWKPAASLITPMTFCLLAPGLVVPAKAADLPQAIVHYQFDADAVGAETVADSSGHHLDATVVNPASASLVADGHGGSALSLPGGAPDSSGAYVRLPRQVLAGTSDLTVSLRVKWDGVTTPWQWIYALGKDNGRYLFTTTPTP